MSWVTDDADINDEAAWRDMMLQNILAHQATGEALSDLGTPVNDMPLEWDAANERDWMHLHNDRHQQEASLSGAPDPPDLSLWDLHDKKQLEDWNDLHSLAHELSDLALGLT